MAMNFTDKVMAGIDAELLRREKRTDRMINILIGICLGLLAIACIAAMFYFHLFDKIKEAFLQTLPSFDISVNINMSVLTTYRLNPVWIIVLSSALLLMWAYLLLNRRFTEKS